MNKARINKALTTHLLGLKKERPHMEAHIFKIDKENNVLKSKAKTKIEEKETKLKLQ